MMVLGYYSLWKVPTGVGESVPALLVNSNSSPPRVLMAIMSMDSDDERQCRQQFRDLFALVSHKICALDDFRRNFRSDSSTADCRIVYTFVTGGNPAVSTELVNASRPILVTPTPASLRNETNISVLNIRENMKQGKSQSWLYYAQQLVQEYGFDYVGKSDSDSIWDVLSFVDFVETTLPAAPYNAGLLIGKPCNKLWWGNWRRSPLMYAQQKKLDKEGYLMKRYGSSIGSFRLIFHLYALGQLYMMSADLVDTVIQEASSRRHEVYREINEDHDVSTMAFHHFHPVRFLMLSKRNQFWEHGIKMKHETLWKEKWRQAKLDLTHAVTLWDGVPSEPQPPPTGKNRVLVGIMSADSPAESANRVVFRKRLHASNDGRVCSLRELELAHPTSNVAHSCAVVYTFVIGGNPIAGTERVHGPVTDLVVTHHAISQQEDDVTVLNVRENVGEGKSQTWFFFAQQFMTKRDFSYAAKASSDILLNVSGLLSFIQSSHLPPSPFNRGVVVGKPVDKLWWREWRQSPNRYDKAQKQAKEGYLRDQFGDMGRWHLLFHFYALGQFYMLSPDLVDVVVEQSQSGNHSSYIEHLEDHDVTTMAFHSKRPLQFIFLSEQDCQFWRAVSNNNTLAQVNGTFASSSPLDVKK